MQDINEWVELRDKGKVLANTRICFEIWATCSRPRIHRNEVFLLLSISRDYQPLHVPARTQEQQVPHSVLQHLQSELAISLEAATSTTSQKHEKWSLLDHKGSQIILIIKFEEVELWDCECEKNLRISDWELKALNKRFEIWLKFEFYWKSFVNHLEILI